MVKRAVVDVPAINIRDHERESPFIWSVNNIRLPKGAKWDFTTRRWQIDLFDDMSQNITIIKSTQMGITLLMICKVLHFAAYNNARIMYTLPRQDDVTDLVNSRIMEMITESKSLAGLLGNIDNVRLKRFGNSYLHFMESSVTPRMLDVDYMVNDEVDMSNQDNLDQYIARLDASDFKIHHRLSTPTIFGFGIDQEFALSDQKYWFVKCPRCNEHQVMDWDKNVHHVEGRTWYACSSCDRDLPPEAIQRGQWVAKFPQREISGYAITQLMSTYTSPASLWNQKATMKAKNFTNLRLGVPYSPTTGNISRRNIIENCFESGHSEELSGTGMLMGVDQGNELHVAVGRMVGENLEIVHLEIVPFDIGFDRVGKLMEAYGVRMCVMDGLPNRHSATQVMNNFRAGRIELAYYSPIGQIAREERTRDKVLVDKTDSFDALADRINEGKLQFYGSRSAKDDMTGKAVSHLSNMRRDEMEQKTKLGGIRIQSVWTNTGPDHFADTINYLNIAAELRGGSGVRIQRLGERNRQVDDSEKDELTLAAEEILDGNNPYARRMGLRAIKRRIAV